MPRNDAAAPGHVSSGIRIHAIDIVQPPGIGISRIADIDAPQTIVAAALAAKMSAETPKKTRSEARSETMGREISRLRVGPTTPTTQLRACRIRRGGATRRPSRCAPWGGPVEPLIAPEAVQSARIGGIGVVGDAVLEHERAHARPLARVRGHIGSGHGRVVGDRRPRHAGRDPVVPAYLPRRLAPVVVFDAALALLLLGERDVEVGVEILRVTHEAFAEGNMV